MIGLIRGRLIHKEPPQLVLDVHGVGYEIEAPMSTWTRLPELGQEVQLRTHLVIREDQHLLFGFATEAERRLFRDLLKVNGIGARLALAILSALSIEAFVSAVQTKDTAALSRVPGIGRKTAERLIVDLRDRVEQFAVPALAAAGGEASGRGAVAPHTEVLNALVSLGYKPAEARRMLDQIPADADGTAEMLRAALRSAAAARG